MHAWAVESTFLFVTHRKEDMHATYSDFAENEHAVKQLWVGLDPIIEFASITGAYIYSIGNRVRRYSIQGFKLRRIILSVGGLV